MTDPSPPRRSSAKFEKRRRAILDAAAVLINQHGVRGLTFVDVAKAVEMNTTSITYYFRKRELLAAAAIEETIRQLDEMTREAALAPDPMARVSRLLRLRLEYSAAVRRGEKPPLAVLGDLRALEDPARAELISGYADISRRVAGFFGALDDRGLYLQRRACAHVVLDLLHWMRAWLPDFALHDFDFVHDALMDLLSHGFLGSTAGWQPRLNQPAPGEEDSAAAYLRAATLMLNARGYRGASVDEIAAQLNLSKGSFYHHIDSKDDLVLECFRASYGRVVQIQDRASGLPGPWGHRLAQVLSDLLAIQFDARFPLLRTTAMQALPAEMRRETITHAAWMANGFGSMLARGAADGSLRPVHAGIAGHCLLALINSAFDFHQWPDAMPSTARAIEVYAGALARGLPQTAAIDEG